MDDVKKWLAIITLIAIAIVGAMLWLRWGWKTPKLERQAGLLPEADYMAKREMLRPLQELKGARPFTPEEMELLRQSVRDMSDFRLRCRALTALWHARQPQQRKEAIELAIERLRDPEWVVRTYALRALAELRAKEAIPSVLPLLNDPNSEVRERAKKTLQQLGYTVH